MISKGILPEFQEFLLLNKLAPEKHVPFLAVWVSKFLNFSNKKGQANTGLVVTEFLRSLETRDDIADWQVRQAEEALRLYLNHFKGSETVKAADGKERPEGHLSDSQRLLAEMKRLIRLKHFAYNTELAYLDWTKRFFAYVRATVKDDSSAMLRPEHVQNFLSHLAINQRVASSTQNQALCALVLLFRDVLGQDLGDISGMVWAKRGKKLPVVLSVEEVKELFRHRDMQSVPLSPLDALLKENG